MKPRHKFVHIPLTALSVAGFILMTVLPSYTYPSYLKDAQAEGYPARNCSYCHISVAGGTGWNERGQWLIEQKKKHGTEEVSVAWLKDYKPAEGAGTQPQAGTKETAKPAAATAPPPGDAKNNAAPKETPKEAPKETPKETPKDKGKSAKPHKSKKTTQEARQ